MGVFGDMCIVSHSRGLRGSVCLPPLGQLLELRTAGVVHQSLGSLGTERGGGGIPAACMAGAAPRQMHRTMLTSISNNGCCAIRMALEN